MSKCPLTVWLFDKPYHWDKTSGVLSLKQGYYPGEEPQEPISEAVQDES